ncbi:Neuroendocrine convertase 2 [Eumeta japonica]|uniref:Neuroendocrine convertase 2 n=1 Tax=Eumeta variegata TaxID=151549 RepID=A0A4C1TH35_EUMVA|nr:Neuroendocrine convertase 2 [Eumeta japonica]
MFTEFGALAQPRDEVRWRGGGGARQRRLRGGGRISLQSRSESHIMIGAADPKEVKVKSITPGFGHPGSQAIYSENNCHKKSGLTLLGIRMLDQPYMTDLIEANSMGHEPHKIHIYSASWGPTDDGRTVDGPRNATMRAIVRGVNEVVRNGLGSLASQAAALGHVPVWNVLP